MKRMVIGDIHGGYKALMQCLERSKFDYKKDLLICLGDIADGWPEVPECVDELEKIDNLILIQANHDNWLLEYLKYGAIEYIWTSQGGDNTIMAYDRRLNLGEEDILYRHQAFFERAIPYYILDNKLFIHGGFDWHISIVDQFPRDLIWDRHLYETACMWEVFNKNHPEKEQLYFKEYDEIFIGHTTTTYSINKRIEPSLIPLKVTNVWNLDQGAGWEGKLSLMDIDSKEYWQSNLVKDLYPEIKGRR